MGEVGLAELVVEVLHNQGTATDPDWSVGSGFVVGAGLVLTAAHNVGPGELLVRWHGSQERPATVRLQGDPQTLDLAVLQVADLDLRAPRSRVGRVARERAALVDRCWAVGFPRFKERPGQPKRQRLSAQVDGEIPTGENLGADRELLTLRVTTAPRPLPQRIPESEWAGMSGAVVFAGDVLVGVVTEHHLPEGDNALSVVPVAAIDRQPDRDAWWALLGVDPKRLVVLPEPAVRRPAYHATVRELARGDLLQRDDELARLRAFATGSQGYYWLVGRPWAGKTTLAAHFVRDCPPGVDWVAYFLMRRRGDASAQHFLEATTAQLAFLLGIEPNPVDRPHGFLDLWDRAVERAEQNGRHLLLVVDGLDEDLGPRMGQPSVASLLPTRTGGRAHVLVTSRRGGKRPSEDDDELPDDVDLGHPLRAVVPEELTASRLAAALGKRAQQDLDWLLGRRGHPDGEVTVLVADLLGWLAAAEGALSVDDLTALAKHRHPTLQRWHVARLLDVDGELGRVVEPVALTGPGRYAFAHSTLLERTQAEFGDGLDEYRGQLRRWAAGYAQVGWPIDRTPHYLLDTYPALLASHAPDQLAALYTDFAYLEAAIQILGVDRVAADLHAASTAVGSDRLLGQLARVVDRSAHQLRPPRLVPEPGYVPRELCLEALVTGDDELAELARQRLAHLPGPKLLPQWTATRTSTALARTLTGHEQTVLAVAVSADGTLTVSGGKDRTVRVWKAADGSQLHQLTGHTGEVRAVAVTADGTRAVSGGDATVRVWELEGGSQLHRLSGHQDWVQAVAVSADGTLAVSGGNDRTVRVWNLADGKQLHRLTGHTGWVLAVAISADGAVAVSGGKDGTVRVWNPADGSQLHQLTGHTGEVRAVAVSADGAVAVSGGKDGTVRVWNVATGSQLNCLDGHEGSVQAVAVNADGTMAVSGGDDQTVRVWSLVDGSLLHRLDGHESWVQGVAVSPDACRAVSGSNDGTVRIWELARSQQPHRRSGHEGWVRAVAVSADGTRAASGGDDGTVRIWELANGRQLHRLSGHDSWVLAVAVSADGAVAVSGGNDGTVRGWQLADGRKLHRLSGHEGWVRGMAISADGRRAVSAGDRTVRVWDLTDGRQLHRLNGHGGLVLAVAVSADGTVAVSGGDDGTVGVWDLTDGRQLHRLNGHGGWVRGVAVSADGRRAVTGGDEGTLVVWDLPTGNRLHRLTGHEDWVLGVAVSADGTRAVSGSRDRTVRLWDLMRGECAAVWHSSRSITSVAATMARRPHIELVAGERSGAVTLFTMATDMPTMR